MDRQGQVGGRAHISNILREDDVTRSRIEDSKYPLLEDRARVPIRVDGSVVHSPGIVLNRFRGDVRTN